MSAFLVTCPDCGATYTAGVVGMTGWPPHACKVRFDSTDPEDAVRWLRAPDDE